MRLTVGDKIQARRPHSDLSVAGVVTRISDLDGNQIFRFITDKSDTITATFNGRGKEATTILRLNQTFLGKGGPIGTQVHFFVEVVPTETINLSEEEGVDDVKTVPIAQEKTGQLAQRPSEQLPSVQ